MSMSHFQRNTSCNCEGNCFQHWDFILSPILCNFHSFPQHLKPQLLQKKKFLRVSVSKNHGSRHYYSLFSLYHHFCYFCFLRFKREQRKKISQLFKSQQSSVCMFHVVDDKIEVINAFEILRRDYLPGYLLLGRWQSCFHSL